MSKTDTIEPIWLPFYVSSNKISSLSNQIKPGVLNGYKQVIGKSKGLGGNIKMGVSNLLAKVFKGEGNIEAKTMKSDTEEYDYSFEELDQKTSNFLIYAEKNHQLLDETSTLKTLEKIKEKGLVKFSGLFSTHIEGESYSEKLANIAGGDYHLKWNGHCGKVKINFHTGIGSLVSHTPLQRIMQSKRSKIHLAGFGTFEQKTKHQISINPIFIGSQLHLDIK